MAYATADQLKAYLNEPALEDRYDALFDRAINAATDKITDYCDLLFEKANSGDAKTAKQFQGSGHGRIYIRDFYVPDGDTLSDVTVEVDWTDDGTHETTLTYLTEWIAGPSDQRAGYPYYYLEHVNGRAWPTGARPRVQVTAAWGWAATPSLVEDVCLQMAAELFKRRDAPFGVAGFDELGAVRISPNQKRVLANLEHLRRYPVLQG